MPVFAAAVAVLIITYPCDGARGPDGDDGGDGEGAEQGILIQGGEALQRAGRITTVVLDKTGSITEGKPAVTDIIMADGVCPVDDCFEKPE